MPLVYSKMFTYKVAKTQDDDTVYILKNVNICCGPCRDVDEDFFSVHKTVDGTTVKEERVWYLTPHSGGTYTHWYPSLVRSHSIVFEHVQICRACNNRYMEVTEDFARNPRNLELEKDLARDAQHIIKKIEANGQAPRD